MILVIIAGGSGTRLWPLSTPDYPKHLLKINSDSNSILQNTYARARAIADKIYVVSESGHINHVRDQLSDLDPDHFIVEPARRGTANCIVAALVKLGYKEDHNEPVAFIHADHFIRDIKGFEYSFRTAEDITKEQNKIVLVGVEPSYPATGFGYIEKDDMTDDDALVYNVVSFKEKPDFETAKEYLRSGRYLWNCGYFVGSINTFRNKMEEFAPNLLSNYDELMALDETGFDKKYLELNNEAIDYALIEKVKDLLVVPAGFDWVDLGSFSDLSKVVDSDRNGNFMYGNIEAEDVTNSYIENHEAKPVAVIGLDNCVVVNTESGVLVLRKDLSQKVGDIVKKLPPKSYI